MRFTVEDQPDLTVPEGLFVRARLDEIKPKPIKWDDKQTGEPREALLLQWWWEVTHGEYKGRKLKGECNAKLSNHPDNVFRQWAEALLYPKELNADMDLETDDLVGLQANISVRHRPDRDDPKKKWEEVDDVAPLVGSGATDDVPF